MLKINQVYHGDCLEVMHQIDAKSIDMILCDLPYGNQIAKWDFQIPLDLLWKHYKRIIKTNGAICLTCKQPFATVLGYSNLDWLRYEWIWHKSSGGEFAKNPYRFDCVVDKYNLPPMWIFYWSQNAYCLSND